MHEYGCPHRGGYGYNAKCICDQLRMEARLSEHTNALESHTRAMQEQSSKDDEIDSLRQQVADLTTRAETAEKAVFTQSQKVIEEGSKVWVPQSQLRKVEAECDAMREAVRVLRKRLDAVDRIFDHFNDHVNEEEVPHHLVRANNMVAAAAAVKEQT